MIHYYHTKAASTTSLELSPASSDSLLDFFPDIEILPSGKQWYSDNDVKFQPTASFIDCNSMSNHALKSASSSSSYANFSTDSQHIRKSDYSSSPQQIAITGMSTPPHQNQYENKAYFPPTLTIPLQEVKQEDSYTNTMDLAASYYHHHMPVPSLPSPPSQGSFTGPMKITKAEKKKKANMLQTRHANSVCSNCLTPYTSQWRTSHLGLVECNACNLYYRKNGVPRPPKKHTPVVTRNRKPRLDLVNPNSAFTSSGALAFPGGSYNPNLYRNFTASESREVPVLDEMKTYRIQEHDREQQESDRTRDMLPLSLTLSLSCPVDLTQEIRLPPLATFNYENNNA